MKKQAIEYILLIVAFSIILSADMKFFPTVAWSTLAALTIDGIAKRLG